VVRVTIVPPPPAFAGSNQHGVASAAYGPYNGAFKVSRWPAPAEPASIQFLGELAGPAQRHAACPHFAQERLPKWGEFIPHLGTQL